MPQPSAAWCISVYKVNFFGEHLFAVLDIEGSNILTIFPTAALENVQFSSVCSYT